MGGGGTVIIRNAIKQALIHPLIHGALPEKMKAVVDPVLQKDVNDWTVADHNGALHVFDWAATHC